MKSGISGSGSTASNLSRSVHHQLNKYALAASAAGVGVLALAQPVEAKIVYTPLNVQIGQQYNLDLNNDGVTHFTLQHGYFHNCSKHGNCDTNGHVFEKPATGNGAIASHGELPAALLRGARKEDQANGKCDLPSTPSGNNRFVARCRDAPEACRWRRGRFGGSSQLLQVIAEFRGVLIA